MALPLVSAQKFSGKRTKSKAKKNASNKKRRPASLLKGRRGKK